MLLSEDTLVMGLCALRQFERTTGISWKFTLHDDGTLTTVSAAKIRAWFPDSRLIFRREADVAMHPLLASHPRLLAFRSANVLGQKLLDTFHYAPAEKYIVLDSDLIFFRRPREILDWINAETDACWFNRDNGEVYSVPRHSIEAAFPVDLWPEVNSGLGLLQRRMMNYDLAEEFLLRLADHTGKAHFHEQTLFAFLASIYGKGGLLPREYRVLWDARFPNGAISCHYVGEGKWHTLYFHLARWLFLPQRTAG